MNDIRKQQPREGKVNFLAGIRGWQKGAAREALPFPVCLITFYIEYSFFTMLCQFPLSSKMNPLYLDPPLDFLPIQVTKQCQWESLEQYSMFLLAILYIVSQCISVDLSTSPVPFPLGSTYLLSVSLSLLCLQSNLLFFLSEKRISICQFLPSHHLSALSLA